MLVQIDNTVVSHQPKKQIASTPNINNAQHIQSFISSKVYVVMRLKGEEVRRTRGVRGS